MFDSAMSAATGAQDAQIWAVGELCRAVADSLSARFNPVTVRGEVSGFSRAASGHCYFSVKDAGGQIRCAMFRRAASLLDFSPRDGDSVELVGRLGVYEQRGDLQLVVEELRRAGQGALFEQFLRLKAKLEAEGLFDAARKRPLPLMPRGIGLVTSLGAAALHDVVHALRRRVPHIPVYLVPAQVQGAQAPVTLVRALQQLYSVAQANTRATGDTANSTSTSTSTSTSGVMVDVILLVRGGGSLEDLCAFNDEALARTIVQSPVPVVCGVGHETDFSIADFCADLRAPTPTAAAELVSAPRDTWHAALELAQERLTDAVQRQLEQRELRLDRASSRLGRPSAAVQSQQLALAAAAQRLRQGSLSKLQLLALAVQALEANLAGNFAERMRAQVRRHEAAAMRLKLLDPDLVLARGYALLHTADGGVVNSVHLAPPGAALTARLADGTVDLTVVPPRLL